MAKRKQKKCDCFSGEVWTCGDCGKEYTVFDLNQKIATSKPWSKKSKEELASDIRIILNYQKRMDAEIRIFGLQEEARAMGVELETWKKRYEDLKASKVALHLSLFKRSIAQLHWYAERLGHLTFAVEGVLMDDLPDRMSIRALRAVRHSFSPENMNEFFKECSAVILGGGQFAGPELFSAIKTLIDEAERVYLAEEDEGRCLPHLKNACERLTSALSGGAL